MSELIDAIQRRINKYRIAEYLIEKNINNNKEYLDLQDENGNTALIQAVSGRQTEIAKLLIENGVDLNLQGFIGYTALMVAAQNGDLEITKLLIQYGADLNLQSDNGNTAVNIATQFEENELAKLLIENGVNLNLQNNYGTTPLLKAIALNNTKLAKLLLRKGSRLDNKQFLELKNFSEEKAKNYIGLLEKLKLKLKNRSIQSQLVLRRLGKKNKQNQSEISTLGHVKKLIGSYLERNLPNKKNNSNNNNNFGGSQFIHIPHYGKRKVRYQKNGRAYVIVNKKKIKL